MVWSASIDTLENGRVQKYSLWAGDSPITWGQAIRLWIRDGWFADWFGALLASSAYPAYFWETPPLSISTLADRFEFVLANSPALDGVIADPAPFEAHLHSADPVVAFANLGKDALLIVPSDSDCRGAAAHLAEFVRAAPRELNRALWAAVGNALQTRVSDAPLWCSTSGLGVYWLHIRLDTFPKYYTYIPYRHRS